MKGKVIAKYEIVADVPELKNWLQSLARLEAT